MKTREKLERIFLGVPFAAACAILGLVTLLICADVVARYFFERPILWASVLGPRSKDPCHATSNVEMARATTPIMSSRRFLVMNYE